MTPKDKIMNNTECSGCSASFECGIEGYDCLCKDCLNAKSNGYLSLDHLIDIAFYKVEQNMKKEGYE